MTHKTNPSWGSTDWEQSQILAVLTVRERNKDKETMDCTQAVDKEIGRISSLANKNKSMFLTEGIRSVFANKRTL